MIVISPPRQVSTNKNASKVIDFGRWFLLGFRNAGGCPSRKYILQVLKLRRNADQTLRELEGLAIKYLKQIPFLRDYAKRPTVTYIVYAVLAAPLITILVPLLTLKGEAFSLTYYEVCNCRTACPTSKFDKFH